MAPSKRWMELVDDRLSETYEMGVQSFLNYAFKRTGKNKEIRCPCVKCSNTYSGTRELVETHMKVYGIVQNYTFWYHHGERSNEPQSESDSGDEEEIEEDESDNEMHEILKDLYPEFSDDNRNFENFNSMSNDEHFSSEKFLAASKRNSNNRAKLSMPHRTGSKPIRQVIWKKGGKVGEPPSLATIFFETRKKGSMLVEQETISTYACLTYLFLLYSISFYGSSILYCSFHYFLKDKIVDVTQDEPSLSNIELVEKCFGPQRHDHVVCYGGGLKPNDMRTNGSKAELQSKLRESQRENQSLKNRMDKMENEVRIIKEMLQRQQSSTSPPPSNGQSI